MLQLINKKKIYFYLFIFLLINSILNLNFNKNLKDKFSVNSIIVNTKHKEVNEKVLLKLNFLSSQNIFFINKNNILSILENLNYLESFDVKKKFPSSIIVNAKKTELIAQTYSEKNKYFIGQNGKLIKEKEITNIVNLPTIFGKFEVEDFLYLKKIILLQKINHKNILKFYSHKNKRWDIYFNNNILLKLPSDNIINSLKLFNKLQKLNKVKPNMIVDLRIPNRVILKSD